MDEQDKTPSIYDLRKEAKVREAARQEKAKKHFKEMQRAFSVVAKTPEGQRVFKYLMDMCGFKAVSIVGDTAKGLIQDRGTLYNEARRNVYLELRKFIPIPQLNEIEKEVEKETDDDD